jgi:hypothetical protein
MKRLVGFNFFGSDELPALTPQQMDNSRLRRRLRLPKR